MAICTQGDLGRENRQNKNVHMEGDWKSACKQTQAGGIQSSAGRQPNHLIPLTDHAMMHPNEQIMRDRDPESHTQNFDQIKKDLDIIADDILYGKENSLFNYK